jgi:hypothetical protein
LFIAGVTSGAMYALNTLKKKKKKKMRITELRFSQHTARQINVYSQLVLD